ncbi:MAG: lysozyme inhibitor LprI family protein [Rhizomicrobium sp.]|jgi:uncharacterized protein YecT (DUF1311 family)
MSSVIGCTLIALVSVGTMAMAASPEEDCGSLPQQAMNACFGRAAARADARLNVVYAIELKGMSDDAKGIALLRAAQRAWVDFRDKNCEWQAHGEEGGSLYPTEFSTCEIKMTEARTRELQGSN